MNLFEHFSFSRDEVLAAAEQFGTPLYIYDAEKMKSQYQRLMNAFSGIEHVVLNYACKANTNLNVLKLFKSLDSGLDTVSINEVKLGLKAGFKPNDIIFTPNGIGFEELAEAASLGVKINIDNLEVLEHFGQEFPDYPVCVRLNPHIMAGGNANISVGHIDSKFGISIHQLPHIHRVVENTGVKIEGLHMHTGSDILDIGVFLAGAELLFEAALSFENLKYLDFGSGFKVPYSTGAPETDIDYLGEMLTKRFKEFTQEYKKDLTLMFEPGKYLVSEAGIFLVKVNVVKHTTSTVFAAVNSGFNHLIRPMFYNAHHEISNISNPEGRLRYYSVTGYICETDNFATNRGLNEVRENDILMFRNAGAYCFSMSSNYNARFRPSEVLYHKGEMKLIRREEKFEDLISTTVEIEI